MKYNIDELTQNVDIRKILTILMHNYTKENEISLLEKTMNEAESSSIISEINIYLGDYKNNTIDKKQFIENIIEISYSNKK